MLKALRSWWWARQRAVDLDILWPAIMARSHGSLVDARHAFMRHAITQPCWSGHYGSELADVIWRLR